jgi:hypothetical protein
MCFFFTPSFLSELITLSFIDPSTPITSASHSTLAFYISLFKVLAKGVPFNLIFSPFLHHLIPHYYNINYDDFIFTKCLIKWFRKIASIGRSSQTISSLLWCISSSVSHSTSQYATPTFSNTAK